MRNGTSFLTVVLALLAGACAGPSDTGNPHYTNQPATGPTPGDSVSLARGAVQRLRSAAVVASENSEVLDRMAARPLEFACNAQNSEPVLCNDFLEETGYATALVTLIDMLPALAGNTAVGLAFLSDPTKVKNFLWLPPGGASNNAMVAWEPRPPAVEGPLLYRLVGTDTLIAAAPVGLLSAKIAAQMFLAQASGGIPNAATARAMGLLFARYAMLMSEP